MLRNLGKKIINNFGLKVLAILFAVVMWIVVVNIDDPVIAKPYTTSVVPVNTDYITSQNKYYEWLDGNNTITFSVSASRSVLDKLENTDFSATADMEKIEYDEKDQAYRVPVTITANRYNNDVSISSKQLYLDVVLEDSGTCQKAIIASSKGTVANGCALGNLEIVGSNLLKISGPYSVVSQIDTAVATINVDGMSTDVTDSVVPVLYDVDGNVIDTTKLKMSLSMVTISAQILNTKDVTLKFATKGEVAEGYVVTDITYSLDTVRIKGEAATLNPINKITIPDEVLDITGITSDLITTVDITSYLPQGTGLVLNSDAQVEVQVKVEPLVEKTFEIPVANITVQNLRAGYAVEYGVDVLAVKISGAKSAIEALNASELYGMIDMNGLGLGEHEVDVSFELDSELYQITSSVTLPIEIVASEDEETSKKVDKTERESVDTSDTEDGDTGSTDTKKPSTSDSEATEDTDKNPTDAADEAVDGTEQE